MVSRSRFKWDLDLADNLEWESSRRMESSTVVDVIIIYLKTRWRIVEICLEISVTRSRKILKKMLLTALGA
ncbi:hypothetical protein A2U01_0088454, partial [Trifolium medium]|nr:hypothetical protein [Trifolium medium]